MRILTLTLMTIILSSCGSTSVKNSGYDFADIRDTPSVKEEQSNDLFAPPTKEELNQSIKINKVTKLEKYIKEFEALTKINIPRSKIKLARMTWRVGVCHTGTQEITINKEYWNSKPGDKAHQLDKRLTVLHELAHCYLGREHMDDTVGIPVGKSTISCPVSIMARKSWQPKQLTFCWPELKEYYLQELVYGGVKVKAFEIEKGEISQKISMIITKNETSFRLGNRICIVHKTPMKKEDGGFYRLEIIVSCTQDNKVFNSSIRQCITHTGTSVTNPIGFGVAAGLNTSSHNLVQFNNSQKSGYRVELGCHREDNKGH